MHRRASPPPRARDNGFCRIAPRDAVSAVRPRYRGPTLLLETEVETAQGAARLVDCRPPRDSHPRIVRVVEGVRGEVAMRMRFARRFDYERVTRSRPLGPGTRDLPLAQRIVDRRIAHQGRHRVGARARQEHRQREGEGPRHL
jgi:hypothetical protein